jgi:phosphoribosylaminoimidazole-succinocarboxamide synthase
MIGIRSQAGLWLGGQAAPVPFRLLSSGKVRDVYELDAEHLLFVTSDRISAFDVVMREGVAHKGRVLTAISAWWFERTRDIVENHLVSARVEDVPGLDPALRESLRGRVLVVRRALPSSVEWVVRGYMAGSGWKEYRQAGSICGVALPPGLKPSSRLPEPILTPTTKEAAHDIPIDERRARERVGDAFFDAAKSAALGLYRRGVEVLARHDIVLADTKFEFGACDGRVVLIDEMLTPDSSRFWDARRVVEGESPPSWDKQILRDWLERQPWNKEPPPPAVDPAILEQVSGRYLELCVKLTGQRPEGSDA